MRWTQGRDRIERLLAERELQRVPPSGGHVAVYEAVRAQLDPPMGTKLRTFDRMRRRRNAVECLSAEVPPLTPADVREDIPRRR